MAVGSEQSLPRFSETFLVNRVTHAVARPAVPNTEALAGTVQEQMIVRILVVFLDEVVIDVLGRQLCLDTVQTHRLEFQHHQRSGRILRECLVDSDPDLLAGDHLALHEMGPNELACDVASHTVLPSPHFFPNDPRQNVELKVEPLQMTFGGNGKGPADRAVTKDSRRACEPRGDESRTLDRHTGPVPARAPDSVRTRKRSDRQGSRRDGLFGAPPSVAHRPMPWRPFS